MRNISKMMCEQVANEGLCPDAPQKERQSKFLDVEEPILASIIPQRSFFNQCGDDYEPNANFVNEPY